MSHADPSLTHPAYHRRTMSGGERPGSSIVPLSQRGRAFRRIVVLTGAGISASAGLPTFRGPGGLWTRNPELADALVAGADPDLMWKALGPLREALRTAAPTAAHVAIARYSTPGALTVITQNVDGLHQRAGSHDVIALHGELLRTRCSACDAPAFDDAVPHASAPPCPACGKPQRPDIVLFEEALGAAEEMGSKRALRDCELFVAIGTSGTVWPAASFVRSAAFEGAHTILLNLTPTDGDRGFEEVHHGAADDLVPALFR
jgi:NAD-dependent deacetylase